MAPDTPAFLEWNNFVAGLAPSRKFSIFDLKRLSATEVDNETLEAWTSHVERLVTRSSAPSPEPVAKDPTGDLLALPPPINRNIEFTVAELAGLCTTYVLGVGRGPIAMASDLMTSDHEEQDDNELNNEDLFGDGDENNGSGYDAVPAITRFAADSIPSVESVNGKQRKLSDEELDSGDDEDRNDRVEDGADKALKEPELANVLAASIGRHADPKPSDNEVTSLPLTFEEDENCTDTPDSCTSSNFRIRSALSPRISH